MLDSDEKNNADKSKAEVIMITCMYVCMYVSGGGGLRVCVATVYASIRDHKDKKKGSSRRTLHALVWRTWGEGTTAILEG